MTTMNFHKRKNLTIDQVTGIISELTGIKVDEMKTPSRRAEIAMPRQVSIFLIHKMVKWPNNRGNVPLQTIGKVFNRHHTTVITSLKTVSDMVDTDQERYVNLLNSATKKMERPKKSA